MVVHPCLVPKAKAALNSLEIAAGEVSASTDVGQALLDAKTHIHALLRDPIGVSNRIIAQAVDLVYFAEYLMEREPDSIHEARNNIHDVMVLAVRRGTQPHDWEGMLRSFSRAFLRDVETLDILMVSRLGNSCRHLFGEDPDPDPKKKSKRERVKNNITSPGGGIDSETQGQSWQKCAIFEQHQHHLGCRCRRAQGPPKQLVPTQLSRLSPTPTQDALMRFIVSLIAMRGEGCARASCVSRLLTCVLKF